MNTHTALNALLIGAFALVSSASLAQEAESAAKQPTPATPATEPSASDEAVAPPAEEGLGLTLSLSWLSAYSFRGLNIFQQNSQTDQNMLLAPSIAWDIMGSGVEIGYWGGYQISGKNIGELIDAGLGAEQDLFVTYTWEMTDWASLTPTLIFYLYPFADEAAAGTAFPAYIDPTVDLTLSWALDFGMKVTYYAGLQSETNAFNHLYLSPSVARSFSFGSRVGLDAKFSFGYKLWQDQTITDNTWDVLFDAGLPITISDKLTVTPRFQAAWTNLGDQPSAIIDPSNPADPVSTAGAHRKEAFAVGGIDLSVAL